jgi:two-component system LytT family response regulator/two-component system response regulator AlgR
MPASTPKNPLRLVVVDDEPIACRRLARLLRNSGCEVLAELGDLESLLEAFGQGLRPDGLFLDIEMPGGTGLDAVADLPEPIPVVFVTAFAEHAVRAFDANAVDYILKPVFQDRLEKALDKLRQYHTLRTVPRTGAEPTGPPAPPVEAPKSGRFPARAGGGHLFLEFRKVSHFEVIEQAVFAWCGGKKFRAPWNALSEVESAFPAAGMMRIQRHILLRPEAVIGHRSLPNGRAKVRVAEGVELEVSRTVTPRLRELLGLSRV